MTLTIFVQEDTHALIVSDTLVSSRADDAASPAQFSTKVTPLLHMNLVICTQGSAEFSTLWDTFVTTQLPNVHDIEALNEVAPDILRALWAAYLRDNPGTDQDMRICHLGFPEGSDHVVRYHYEAGRDFEPERFDAPHVWRQPNPEGVGGSYDTVENVVDIATRIRDLTPDRIGGELQATIVEKGRIQMMTWHRFPDYDAMRARMGANRG